MVLLHQKQMKLMRSDAWDIEVSETAKEVKTKEQLKDTTVNVANELAFTDGLWNGTVPYPQRFIKAKHVLEIEVR